MARNTVVAPTTTTTNPTASREYIMIYRVADFMSFSKVVAGTVSCPEAVDRKPQVLCDTDGSVA